MKIFAGITYNDHYNTIHDAVAAVIRRAQYLSLLKTPWSLVELLADADDFNWLCAWAGTLSPAVVSHCLNNGHWQRFQTDHGECSRATGIGILLLLFEVEVARRNASERSLWSAISNSYFSTGTKKVLFAQNHPVRAHKDAIELAARWLKLRHVFGIEGLQTWYDTVYLQLGFTKLGFSSRLPEWLVGQNSTVAIHYLLDGPMCSQTFRELWQALNQFRRKNMTEVQLRRQLQDNPWVLPEWLPELIQQATARIQQLGYAPNSTVPAMTSFDIAPDEFLDTPRLTWDPGTEPTFTCRIINLSLFDLTEIAYTIMVADHICATLRRYSDGSYSVEPSDVIRLPFLSPLIIANLLTPDGHIIQNQELRLWDEGEDILAFTAPTGRSHDPWKKSMQAKDSYYLALASDLEIQPRPTHWYALNAHTRLYWLEKNWPASTQVLLEGHVLWQSQQSCNAISSEQVNKDTIQIYCYDTPNPLAFGLPIRFRISHPRNYTITFIRSAGQSIGFDQYTSQSTVTKAIALQPHMLTHNTSPCLQVTLGIQVDTSPRITRLPYSISIPIIGAAVLDIDGWIPLDPNQPLNVEQAKRQLMRFYLTDEEDWPLLEGDTWLATTWRRPKSLRVCAGFGSLLKIQKSAYNASALDPPQLIAREVINTGCVKTIHIEDAHDSYSRMLYVQLTSPIEPDLSHSLVWWDQNGTYTLLKPKHSDVSDGTMRWSTVVPDTCGEPLAVGVAYAGNWLGTWYRQDWSQICSIPTTYPSTIAILLRWFHLPLVSHISFSKIERFSSIYAVDVLPIWLAEYCPFPDLQFASGDDRWLSVVRTIFSNWQPKSGMNELVQGFIDPILDADLFTVSQQIVAKLSRVSPILMAKIFFHWVETVCIPQGGKRDSLALVQYLLYGMAEVHDQDSLAKRQRYLLQELVASENGERRKMDVDENFIKKILLDCSIPAMHGQAIEQINQENIAVAMQIEPFRQLQSIYLLEHIYNQLKEDRSRM